MHNKTEEEMTLSIRKIVLFLSLLIFTIYCKADFQDLKFSYLTVDNGLSNNRIRCVYRDSEDYLWIGTNNGLNRYDGNQIIVYKHSEVSDQELSNNDIQCIFEDSHQNLWIGTSYGLNILDKKTDTFHTFYNEPGNIQSINYDIISAVVEDKYGHVWIATQNGFCKWLPESGNFKQYYFPVEENNRIHNFIYNLSYDQSDHLWFGTQGNLLWSYNIRTDQFESLPNPMVPHGAMEKRVQLYENTLWIGTVGNGLISFDIKKESWKQFPVLANGEGTTGKDIKGLTIDSNEYLLIAIDQGGVNRLKLETQTFDYCVKDELKENGLNNNGIWTIHKDIEGIFYVGTSAGGLNINNPKEDQFTKYTHNIYNKNSLIYDIVYCLFEDSQGLIWIGTDGGGLSVFNPKTKSFKNYKHHKNNKNSLSGNAVLCIGEDRNHNIWIGTWGAGLNKFNRQSESFTHYFPNENDPSSLSGINIWDFKFDDDGQLWITYFFEKGVDLFDIEKGVIKRYRDNPDDPTSIISNNVVGIRKLENELGFLTSEGFCTFQKETNSFSNWDSLNLVYLNDAYRDSKGNNWFCTSENGLIKINTDGSIERFNEQTGLITNQVTGVIEDTKGQLWITSYKGLFKYNRDNEFTYNYLSKSDFGHQFAIISHLKAKDGTFYLGGYNGFYTFHPDRVAQNKYLPTVVFDELQIFNKTVSNKTSGSPLNNNINHTNELTLSYKQAVFSIDFNAINYTYPNKAKFAYKLEGYDQDWTYTGSDRRYASYTNLNPGTYTFMVKASNNDNVWNEVPKTIKIIITPPFWERWWFRILMIALFIGSALFLYYKRVNELKEQKRLLEKTVSERTAELQKANEELEKRRNEIMRQNKAFQKQNIELNIANQTKNKLFSIIAHDLKGPVGSISTILETANNKEIELDDKMLNSIALSSQQVYELLEDLLIWARSQNKTLQADPALLNVKSIFEKAISTFNLTASKKNIEINIDTIDDKWSIIGDDYMINTIVRNLVNNALKFTKPLGSITLSAKETPGHIELSISDTGIGMHKSTYTNLFAVGDEHTSLPGTNNEKGTGLGLMVCKELIGLNKGKIGVESEIGKGSRFWVSLPKAEVSFKKDTGNDHWIKFIASKKTLYIESSSIHIDSGSILFRNLNLSWDIAATGEKGIQRAKSGDYDLIFMSINLPDINGIEVAKRIRKKLGEKIILIALTSYNQIELRKMSDEDLFDGYLHKPLRMDDLKQTILNIIP